jgi:hypothetical protein
MIKQAKNKTPRKPLTVDAQTIRPLREGTLVLIAAGRHAVETATGGWACC